jgi:hypothetical protein
MPTQVHIINDIGTLLRLPSKVTTELTDKACLCIGSAIAEAKNRDEVQTTVNIGIGVLSINLVDMQCKFIPGKNLKTAIKQAMAAQVDPVELMLEQSFADRLITICNEVL